MSTWSPYGRRRASHPSTLEGPGGHPFIVLALITVNVVFYLATLVEEGTSSAIVQGSLRADGALRAAEVADGEVWRIVSSAFLHGNLIHIGFNMALLWWLGSALEHYAGSLRMAIIYFSAVVWGAAGALQLNPDALTLGASGGVFGLMGAVLWIEYRERHRLMGGSIWALLVLNLVISFAPGISLGGHLGGLAGGLAAAIAISGMGRFSLARDRVPPWAIGAGVAVLVAGVIASVAIAEAA